MRFILPLRRDLVTYLKAHQLIAKWHKASKLFQENPRHPSLHTELLEPKDNFIYSFRIDQRYRALFYVHENGFVEVIAFTNHYR